MTVVMQRTTIEGLDVEEVGRQGGFTVYADEGALGETELFFCTGVQVICQVTVETDSESTVRFFYEFTGHG